MFPHKVPKFFRYNTPPDRQAPVMECEAAVNKQSREYCIARPRVWIASPGKSPATALRFNDRVCLSCMFIVFPLCLAAEQTFLGRIQNLLESIRKHGQCQGQIDGKYGPQTVAWFAIFLTVILRISCL